MPKKDLNQIAASVMRITTGQTEPETVKNSAAVALGRLGGLKGGRARAESLSKNERREIAARAARARWTKKQ